MKNGYIAYSNINIYPYLEKKLKEHNFALHTFKYERYYENMVTKLSMYSSKLLYNTTCK